MADVSWMATLSWPIVTGNEGVVYEMSVSLNRCTAIHGGLVDKVSSD